MLFEVAPARRARAASRRCASSRVLRRIGWRLPSAGRRGSWRHEADGPVAREGQRGTSGSAWELNSSAFCDSESVCR